MSVQINHARGFALNALPMILCIAAASVAVWLGLQSAPLPNGQSLVLHPALTNTPPDLTGKVGDESKIPALAGTVDPFWRTPPAEEVSMQLPAALLKIEEIHLTTIAEGANGRYCLVNGKIFREGQAGDGFTVHAIGKEEVVFRTGREDFSLKPGQRAAVQGERRVPLEYVLPAGAGGYSEEPKAIVPVGSE